MKKNFQFYVRSLHRDLGFFTIGLVIIYSLSGIILIHRSENFMKQEVVIEKTLPANLSPVDLASALKLKNLKVTAEDSTTIYFTEGTYSKTSGIANYTAWEVIPPFNKLVDLHKGSTKGISQWFTTLFGIVLIVLAISSFWMFKTGTKQFRRGIWMAGIGIAVSIILLFAA